MGAMVPFQYGEFWDVPRYLTFRYRERAFYLQSEFDDDLDDYPKNYSVYIIDESVADSAAQGSWEFRDKKQMSLIGEVLVADVRFDPSKREELDASCLDCLIDNIRTQDRNTS